MTIVEDDFSCFKRQLSVMGGRYDCHERKIYALKGEYGVMKDDLLI